jgi:acyl-CoA dehydrogenase
MTMPQRRERNTVSLDFDSARLANPDLRAEHEAHQVIRHKIAEMKQRINATQGYLQCVSRQIALGHEDAGDIALLKVQCSQTMEFCAREAMQILGGMGYMRGSRVERIYREVRVNAIGGGSEEIMRDLAARQYQL